MPDGYRALVVDNNSTDGTADVARRRGAEVVLSGRGVRVGGARRSRCRATPIVAVLDGDGSMDPGELPPAGRTLEAAAPTWSSGGAGRCGGCAGRGTRGSATPRCAGGCAPNTAWPCTTSPRCGWPAATRPAGARRDRPPIGVSARTAGPRRRGELARGRTRRRLRPPHRRKIEGQRFACAAVSSPRSTSGRPSRDDPRCADCPGGGEGAGTRARQDAAGARRIGDHAAADVAAAALLDTLDAVAAAPVAARVVALTGDLDAACRAA